MDRHSWDSWTRRKWHCENSIQWWLWEKSTNLDIDLLSLIVSNFDFFFVVVEVFNYFRAIEIRQEFTDRALGLTSHALRLNSLNYNVWVFRRKILRNLKFDFEKELCWSEEMIWENPKNFYAWEHRRSIANSSCTKAETELNLTEAVLVKDSKNYLAWQHRQWTVKTFKFSNFGLLSNELCFTEKLLDDDIRNNSAWNQRFFILKVAKKIKFSLNFYQNS